MPDEDKFNQIKQAFLELENSLQKGKGLVYRTEKGIYGTTGMDRIFNFFKEINLQDYKHLLDLGSGDGRVVLIASLFTKATGIEYDAELNKIAIEIRDKLNLECDILTGDYMQHDFTQYDIVFINPDHDLSDLSKKLRSELKGSLFIYNELFSPEGLRKGKKFWAGQIPVVSYTK